MGLDLVNDKEFKGNNNGCNYEENKNRYNDDDAPHRQATTATFGLGIFV